MIEPFMIKALIAGTIIAVIGGFLGCIIVWRRLACFSDCISHAVLPGIALGFIFNISLAWSAFFTAILISVFLGKFKEKLVVSIDTFLIIIAQIMFSLGVIILYKNPQINSNLMNLLLGDILSISTVSLVISGLAGLLICAVLIFNWNKIITMCINEEIAISEGIKANFLNLIILILIAIFTAISMQSIGIILATSILLIPTTTARMFSKSAISMPYIACFIGILGIVFGISLSYFIDVPTSPAIVMTLGIVLFFSFFFKK